MEWFIALGSILLLDLILSGDNAILIALACKNLPLEQRKKAMFIGCFGAVFIRVCLTLFATSLLSIDYLQFLGGLTLLYIAINLLINHSEDESLDRKPVTLMAAIKTILIADLIMSLDNILSLAGVAQTVGSGKWSLIICGLLASIPLVLWGSQLFLTLMSKFSAIVYVGAGILAFTAGKLVVMDQAIGKYLIHFSGYIEGLFVILVLTIGYIKNKPYHQTDH
ncbi:TerC family protein [Anaerosinus massiliensis]|uniref:TerC family protein n=1 Tax=Massilibacillus massiliensis TaxID=1806837 RepID=UPI000B2883A0|nr:TerC family protein [Massilibacillus massiliensis]